MRKNRKLFLSPSAHEYGTICTLVETPMSNTVLDYDKERRIEADANVRISDCNKNIYLDFDFKDEDSYRKRKEKVRVIIDTLKTFEEEMDIAFEDLNRLKSYYREEKAKEKEE